MNEEHPKIVVGADGSDLSVGALRWAAEQARRTRADLVVVTAYEIPVTIFFTPTYTEMDYLRDAEAVLARTLEGAFGRESDVPVQTELVQARPAHALTEAAKGAQLLVIGSHGHGEIFPGMHLGSVASYCVHHAPCPVLVYRGAETGR